MTLIISWVGVDSRGIASLYMASDSRYSWGNAVYDHGIKVFGSSRFPEIFGFCGDVLFPSIVLGQLIPQIDAGLLITDSDDSITKNDKVLNYIKSSLNSYPTKISTGSFKMLHGTRTNGNFNCYLTEFSIIHGLKNYEVPLPKNSTVICSAGSGKKEFDENYERARKNNNYGTSRGVFNCFSKTLMTIKDPFTGGMPQIVGLYRIGNRLLFGIVSSEKKYIYGKETSEDINSSSIEWRNENFERMDPRSLKLLSGAQRQPA